jgi:hypothetical protein
MLPYTISDLMVYSFDFYTISRKNIPKIKFSKFFKILNQNFLKSNYELYVKVPSFIFESQDFGYPPFITNGYPQILLRICKSSSVFLNNSLKIIKDI